MNRPRNLREDEAAKALTLINEGHSQRYVANLLGIRQSTIRQGRKKSTDARDERYLMQVALSNRRSTSLELSRTLTAARNVTISAQTVRRRLNKGGLDSRRAAIAPLLTREHTVTRLRFAREHVNWTIDASFVFRRNKRSLDLLPKKIANQDLPKTVYQNYNKKLRWYEDLFETSPDVRVCNKNNKVTDTRDKLLPVLSLYPQTDSMKCGLSIPRPGSARTVSQVVTSIYEDGVSSGRLKCEERHIPVEVVGS
ncbi:hypothetical protein ILUMI_24500 [Ignelater luminosus]|uniref:Transposase Tc1-like domain-containing protein n=1 Tax=Ignelater luminosus TaxID=2038154 RepID=A0A8K0CBR2_IGNLU|nr:hypothetical protein ILUMI_24500 [Ignelater luminosus]